MATSMEKETDVGGTESDKNLLKNEQKDDAELNDGERATWKRIKFIVFVVFLIDLAFVSFGMTRYSQYHLTRALMATIFETHFGGSRIFFDSIASVPEIWLFMEELLLPQVFPEPSDANETATYILSENLLLGLPRLRQIKVHGRSCEVHEDFRTQVSVCFSEYSQGTEDKESFGPATGTAWKYHSEEELDGTSYWGFVSHYSGAGSFQDLGPHYEDARRQMNFLQENSWIRRGTRVVFFDFTVYNANVNLFSTVKIVFELPPSGGVWPSTSIHTMKLLRYIDSWDYFILGWEIGFCCLTAYYLLEEMFEIKTQKCAYFKSKWNILDTLILMLSMFSIGFGVYRTVLIDKLLKQWLRDPDHYHDFEFLGYWQMQSDNIIAVLVFVSWIKVFKYLSFNMTMKQLSTTLSECAKDVGGFAIMFFIVFLAYAQLGYLLFGTQLPNFSRLQTSIFTLLIVILGNFDYVPLERANRVLGPLFFVSYVFFVFFVLMNMFLAILSDTYSAVKGGVKEEDLDKVEFVYILKWISNKIRRIFGKKDLPKETVADGVTESKLKDISKASDENKARDNKSSSQRNIVTQVKLPSMEDFERNLGGGEHVKIPVFVNCRGYQGLSHSNLETMWGGHSSNNCKS